MTELNNNPDPVNKDLLTGSENRTVNPLQEIYSFLSSKKLAIGLLIIILVCCLMGVTLIRGARASALIFGTLWFNAILVLLVINVCFCFFGRIWGRRVTLISLGMILFHLSFVAMLIGIVYNSLFFFRGSIRLAEGETLPSGVLQSYDYAEYGRFFNFKQMKGDTTLLKMHTGYRADGSDRRAAYEIAVGEGAAKKQGVIYITKSMEHNRFRYFNDKEGYSVGIFLHDKQGKELYAAFVPLQSFKDMDEKNNTVIHYTTGTKEGPGSFAFPPEPLAPLFTLQVTYFPSQLNERSGEVLLQVWPLPAPDSAQGDKTIAYGKIPIGGKIAAGDYSLEVKEARYWAGMIVHHEPGEHIVLVSLWVGLIGMIITFIGRLRREKK
jgi:hypothetical protein